LIDNSKTAHVGTAPWNVGIYRFNNKSSKYDLICGGSTIAPNVVISGKKCIIYIMNLMLIILIIFLAANCFSHNGMQFNRLSINGVYKIAVGKHNKDMKVIDNDFTQVMDVSYKCKSRILITDIDYTLI